MTSIFDLIRFLGVLYPNIVLFFLIALAWNASGQAGNLIDFRSFQTHESSWKAPDSPINSCAKKRSPKSLTIRSCQVDDEPEKLIDK